MMGLAAVIGSGCASIVDGGSDKSVSIKTNPAGATVTIINKKQETIFTQTTPTIVSLDRGGFFVPAEYKLHFEYPGYYPRDVKVKSTVDGWYLGNVIFGGVLGLLIVDPGTGAMWTLSPRQVTWNLVPHTTELSSNELALAELKLNPVPVVTHVKPPNAK